MAKGPDLSSPAANPHHEAHVRNVQGMIQSASPNQRIAGIGWYRRAAQDMSDIATGRHPGQMAPHPDKDWAERGITVDKPGTGTPGSELMRNQRSEAQGHEMDHALARSQGHAEDLARSGYYQGQRMSHANTNGLPFGHASAGPHYQDAALAIAAMSPAGPTGMTWANNPRAVADTRHLSDTQFNAVVHANTQPVGTPERKAASEIARAPFKGTAVNHQTTLNTEKGMRAMRGEYRGTENPLGRQKTQHFANDIYNEVHPGHPQNVGGMTGTIDKHQEDVIAGTTKSWGTTTASGFRDRAPGERKAGEDHLPSLSTDKGYAYQRGVVQEAASREGLRPKEAQAVSWVTQKAAKDPATAEKRRASLRAGRAKRAGTGE